MVMDMNASAVQTLEQLRSFLAGSVDVALDCPGDASRYPLHRRCPSAATTPDWHVHTPRHSSNAPTPCFFVIDDIDPRKTWYHPGTCLIPPTKSAIKRCARGIRTPTATRIFTPLFDMHDLAKSTSAHSILLAGSS